MDVSMLRKSARVGALVLVTLTGCHAAGRAEPAVGGASRGEQVAAESPQQMATGGEEWGIVGGVSAVRPSEYEGVVRRVATMVTDGELQRRVQQRALHMVNVTWEDTGRAEGSALGPNISDLTLQVRYRTPGSDYSEALMPVIRFPNFGDRTGDVRADKFLVRVGNERGAPLASVPLADVLRDLKRYVSVPESIHGSGNLVAPRDSHFLVSAQAVFLPIPQQGRAEFNPVLFNYQSAPGSPAVLALLVTREGTSVKVIENTGDDVTDGGGQELYFNNRGARAAFTAERKSDVEAKIAAQGGPRSEADRSALAKGADVLFLVQVPLRHRNRGVLGGAYPAAQAMPSVASGEAKAAMASDEEGSNVEQAVLGHGPNLGRYREGTEAVLERDPQFPIRITVQFYKATSNGVVSEADLDGIARSIGGVYEHADYVGSLVVPQGDPRRPTAWQTIPNEWFPW